LTTLAAGLTPTLSLKTRGRFATVRALLASSHGQSETQAVQTPQRQPPRGQRLRAPEFAKDPTDGSAFRPHRVNPKNGMYRGRQVLNVEV
jgi:ribosomal protein L32